MKNNKKKNNKTPLNQSFGFFKSDRFRYSAGAFILLFGLFLTISFVSYLFTWKIDQSKLGIEWYDFIFSSDILVDNWTGKTGALLSNKFIHDWFGLASFSFVFILIFTGLRLFEIKLFHLGKFIKYCFLITIWLSFTLGYIFKTGYFLLGGGHGYFMSKWFCSFAGDIGTIFLIFISFFVFTVFSFDKPLIWLKKLISKKDSNTIAEADVNTIQENDVSDEVIEEVTKDEEIVVSETQDVIPVIKEMEIVSRGTEEINDTENIEVKTTGDIEFTKEEISDHTDELTEDQNIEPMPDFDPTLDLSNYKFPDIDLLVDHKSGDSEVTDEELNSNKDKIVATLQNYSIKIDKIKATIGPTVTLYEIVPAPGVRISKIKNLEDDIALSLSALGIRIIAPIPGKGTIGIEVPNMNPEVVSMRSVIASKKFQESRFDLPVVLGKTISNEVFTFDLAKMPHLLVAGATGQGKSVGLNAIITSLLYKMHPSQLKFVMIDPKKVELTLYSRLEKHFLAKLPSEEESIITDTQKVVATLNSLTKEMDSRYNLMKKAQLRNIKEYNAKFIKRRLNPEEGHRFLPFIVVIVDEFADLIMTAGKEIEQPIARIAQLARAVGIHLIIATQRPSTNIITGMIKANFPARIAFKVVSMIDSRTILDTPGANQLIGRGDMLILQGSTLVRVQCAFVDTPEVEAICDFISGQQSYGGAFELPEPDASSSESGNDVDLSKKDDLFNEAARLVVTHQQGSTSLIQRKFAIGYNRAGRVIDQLEAAGIVGPYEGSKARQVLFTDLYALEQFLNNMDKS